MLITNSLYFFVVCSLFMQVPTVIGVTHNNFQMIAGASQGGSVFGLIDGAVNASLDNGAGHPCFDAYVATSPQQWNRTATHYCCTSWQVGCGSVVLV